MIAANNSHNCERNAQLRQSIVSLDSAVNTTPKRLIWHYFNFWIQGIIVC